MPGNNDAHAAIKLIAPSLSADHRKAAFTDADGDRVTVTVNRGAFSADDFTIFAIDGGPHRSVIHLADDGAECSYLSAVWREHLFHVYVVGNTGIDDSLAAAHARFYRRVCAAGFCRTRRSFTRLDCR